MIDRRALSKALSRIASAPVEEILREEDGGHGLQARVVGVTGSPGAGKSTLIARLAAARLQHVQTLAIIAIDPTSPRSGGSLLGDRIRMGSLSEDPRVFIRSLPSRSVEDGLTDNIAEIVSTLHRFGFEEVIIETVGVGQTAYGIRTIADAEVLVLAPGAGDYVQAMKAGIMETADIYVVNKADQPGADRVAGDLLGVLDKDARGRSPPVITISQDDPTGIARLDDALQMHFQGTASVDESERRRRARQRFRVRRLLQRRLDEVLAAAPADLWDGPLADSYARVVQALARRDTG